jgi:hypothetical protein
MTKAHTSLKLHQCLSQTDLVLSLLCRLFTIDWFKPEIVSGQYNSRAGISNVIFPGGRGNSS